MAEQHDVEIDGTVYRLILAPERLRILNPQGMDEVGFSTPFSRGDLTRVTAEPSEHGAVLGVEDGAHMRLTRSEAGEWTLRPLADDPQPEAPEPAPEAMPERPDDVPEEAL
jgi:hypothetical protein